MANFSLLAKYILKMRGLFAGKAKRYIIGKFLILYLAMAATLVIGATKGMATFAGCSLGLLVIKGAIFSEAIRFKIW